MTVYRLFWSLDGGRWVFCGKSEFLSGQGSCGSAKRRIRIIQNVFRKFFPESLFRVVNEDSNSVHLAGINFENVSNYNGALDRMVKTAYKEFSVGLEALNDALHPGANGGRQAHGGGLPVSNIDNRVYKF